MLKPQEVKNKKIKITPGGDYEKASVDDFINSVGEAYISLYKENEALNKENAALKAKLKLLADKLMSILGDTDY